MSASITDPAWDDEYCAMLREASHWAERCGARYVEPEHLLVALLAERDPDWQQVGRSTASDLLIGLGARGTTRLAEEIIAAWPTNAPVTRQARFVTGGPVEQLLHAADAEATATNPETPLVGTPHLLAAMLREASSLREQLAVLRTPPIEADEVLDLWRFRISTESHTHDELEDWEFEPTAAGVIPTETESQVARDLTALAAEGKLDPLIGRDAELARMMRILSRRTKNNVVLLGDAGVGKTSLAEGLAQRLVDGDVPAALAGARLLSLTPADLVSGTVYRGQFEARLRAFLDSIAGDNVILFIDEMHSIVGAGSVRGDGNDLANLLKPRLARGELRVIGATTREEYRAAIEADAALERRFEPLQLAEPSPEATLDILRGLAARYARHHRVRYTDAALAACVRLAGKHRPARRYPDKAIDLLDEAGAASAAAGKRSVTPELVEALVSSATTTPTDLAAALAAHLPGREAVAERVARLVRTRRAGLVPRSGALAAICLVGPTGSGKSELARAVADAAFGGALTDIDLAAYAERHAISGLIGSPPGYVGYDEPARLVEPLRHTPRQVLLLRHADAADPAVRALIAELLSSGQIRDTRGRLASVREALVILTVTEAEASRRIGFGATAGGADPDPAPVLGRPLADALDISITLVAPSSVALETLVERQLANIGAELARRGVTLSVAPALRRAIAERSASGQGLTRSIEHLVEEPLAAALAEVRSGTVTLDHDGVRTTTAIRRKGRRR